MPPPLTSNNFLPHTSNSFNVLNVFKDHAKKVFVLACAIFAVIGFGVYSYFTSTSRKKDDQSFPNANNSLEVDGLISGSAKKEETLSDNPHSEIASDTLLIQRFMLTANIQGLAAKKINNLSPSEIQMVQELQESIFSEITGELANSEWHGSSSLQRLVWQNTQMLAFLSTKGNGTLLFNAHNQNLLESVYGYTLGTLVFEGYTAMLPEYLLTTPPNFCEMIPGFTGIAYVHGMGYMPPCSQEGPTFIELERDRARQVLTQFQNELLSLCEEKISSLENENFIKAIEKADTDTLITFIKMVLEKNPNNPTELVLSRVPQGVNPSTDISLMQTQCEGVMKFLTDEYIAIRGCEVILQYPLVSHALDAKHLLAALSAQKGELAQFERFFEACLKNSKANEQIRIRLQQAAYLIWQKYTKLDLTPQEIFAGLEKSLLI